MEVSTFEVPLSIAALQAEEMPLRPSWLADLPCATGTEDTVQDCGDLAVGDTSSCGFTQRLLCSVSVEGASRRGMQYWFVELF